MDPSSQLIVPTIIDVPELIVTNDDLEFDDNNSVSTGIWYSRLQYLASISTFIIGLGNVWRFPYLCYKYGGGAFLFTYTIMNLLVGLPLVLMELAFGQYANEGPITIWRVSSAFEGLGYCMCLISAIMAIYYNYINAWIIHYLLGSITWFFTDLPWSRCDNSWNFPTCISGPDRPVVLTPNCTKPAMTPTGPNTNGTLIEQGNCRSKNDSFEFERIINTTNELTLPANEYFHNNVLDISESLGHLGSLNFDSLACVIICCGLVFVIVSSGRRMSVKLATGCYAMSNLCLVTLLVRAITLPGAGIGIDRYFSAKWIYLKDIGIWADSITQLFFAMSPCWGGIITYASMNKFHNNFQSDAKLIVGLNYVVSFVVGLATFATLGFMSKYSGIEFDNVADSGPGLLFLVAPEALGQLPAANLNTIIFFLSLAYLGLSSQLNVIDTLISTLVDTWPHKLRYRKPLILIIMCISMFFFGFIMSFGNGFYLAQIIDGFGGTYTALTIGLFELIAIAWVYGIENFLQDIDDMMSVHRNLFPSKSYWYFMWKYLTPSVVFAILLFSIIDLPLISYRDHDHPQWSSTLGWLLTSIVLLQIPALAVIRFVLSPRGSFMDKINYLCRPSEDWAPSSYVSGPKLINRHMMNNEHDSDFGQGTVYSDRRFGTQFTDEHSRDSRNDDDDDDDDDSNEDLKVVDGRANYIIPEEEDDTDNGLITNETNV